MFSTIFQITYFKIWRKHNCMFSMYIYVCVCVCVCFFFSFFQRMNIVKVLLFYLRGEKISSLDRAYSLVCVCVISYQVGLTIFIIVTKISLSDVIWKLRGSLNIVFKHPKIKNVIQTLRNEISYQTRFFFFFWLKIII